jgi:hypothetical protein
VTGYIAPFYKYAIINDHEDWRLNKYDERIRDLGEPSLLRVRCLSLIQEVYNHWKISHPHAHSDYSNNDLNQAYVSNVSLPSPKCIPTTILPVIQHKKKGRVPSHA